MRLRLCWRDPKGGSCTDLTYPVDLQVRVICGIACAEVYRRQPAGHHEAVEVRARGPAADLHIRPIRRVPKSKLVARNLSCARNRMAAMGKKQQQTPKE